MIKRGFNNFIIFFTVVFVFVAFQNKLLAWNPPTNPPTVDTFSHPLFNLSWYPDTILELNSRLTIDASSTDIGLFILNTHNHNPEIDIGASVLDGTHWAIYNNLSDNQLRFWNQGADNLLVFTPDGKVGIGTTTPQQQLSLAGNISIVNTTHDNLNGIVYKGNTAFIHDFNWGDNGTVVTEGRNLFIGENAGNFTMGQNATESYQASNNVGIGYLALRSLENGYENVAIGSNAMLETVNGAENVAIGFNVLKKNVNGSKNVAFGWNALVGTTSSFCLSGPDLDFNSNVAIGAEAMRNVCGAWNNTAIGYRAMFNVSDWAMGNTVIGDSVMGDAIRANQSVFIGKNSGYTANSANDVAIGVKTMFATKDNTRTNANVAVGYNAMYNVNGGYSDNVADNNIAFGYKALHSVQGDENVAIGYLAMGDNLSQKAYANVALGRESLAKNLNSAFNVAVGVRAMYLNQTGEKNVAIGSSTLYLNVSGSNNVAVGAGAMHSNYTGSDNVAVGSNALYSGSYHSVAVGDEALSQINDSDINARYNVALGRESLWHVKGDYNVAVGWMAGKKSGYSDISLNNSVFIGDKTEPKGINDENEIVIGVGVRGLGSNSVVLGSNDIATTTLNGFVGLGTTTPLVRLHVDGDMIATGTLTAASVNYLSDKRLKTNTQSIQNALEKIKKLRGVEFNWKNESANSKKHLGLIAQEVEKVFPEAVSTGKDGYKSVEYANLIAPLVEVIKKQQETSEKMDKILDQLEQELN